MAIVIYDGGRRIRLETRESTYEMKADGHDSLMHAYYGRKSGQEDLSYAFMNAGRSHEVNPPEEGFRERIYSLGTLPLETSGFGGGDYRETALRVRFMDGSKVLRLRYESYEVRPGKYAIPGLPASYGTEAETETLVVRLVDPEAKIRVELLYGVFEELNVLTRAMRVINDGDAPVFIEKAASLQLDFFAEDLELLSFPGRWAGERLPERAPLRKGITSFGSLRGISGAAFNPSAILLAPDATEEQGLAYGISFVYSGEFLFEAERTPVNDTRILLGIHPDNFEWKLEPGEAFDTPEAVLTFSENGISGVSRQFHRFIREHIVRGPWKHKRCPVLLNNWEGTYFSFTGEKLLQIAREAANAGAELFVLDDGWFGKRDGELSGLGDWQTNEAKLGMTLEAFGEKIRALGLGLGLWVEPEGISEDSDLYRAHPDWAIRVPSRLPSRSRFELVLDMSREEVQEHLIHELTARIREAKLQYLKWDLNRGISDRYSTALPADRQGELTHRFMLGTYRVIEALRTELPDLLIEGCCSGGARFDLGMLCYTPQIWTSDDTDPVERLRVQYGTSMIYPVKTMGAHVSAAPNHQTGRATPMNTRAIVAMSGTFGYELDPTKMSEAEKEEMRQQIRRFKDQYETLAFGEYFRLVPPTSDSVTVWEQAASDGSRAIVNVVFHAVRPNADETKFRVQGLTDDALYRISLVEPAVTGLFPEGDRPILDGKVLSGRTLRTAGLYAPIPAPKEDYPAYQILLERVE